MKKLLCTVALVGMLVAPGAVQAQMEVGGFAAFHNDLGPDAVFGVGGYVGIPLPQIAPGFALVPDVTWFFPDGGDYFEVNGDVGYNFPVGEDAPVLPFAFGGLNIAISSPDVGNSSTDLGLNLGGGIYIPAGSVMPFVGAKFEIQDQTGFVMFGGLAFPIGGGGA